MDYQNIHSLTSHQLGELAYFSMSEDEAKAICQWEYAAPYSCYNWPSWEALYMEQRELADPDLRASQYFSVKVIDGLTEPIAYFQLFPLLDTIRIGLFVHPQLQNKGIGKTLCRLAIEAAKAKFSQPNIDLEVATWNERAIHLYKQCGFKITDEYILFSRTQYKEESVYNMVYMK